MFLMNYYMFSFIFLFIFGLMFFFIGLYFLNFDYLILLDWDIMEINSCSLVFTLFLDYISLIFMGCVLFISSMVVLYSKSYMTGDKYNIRFLFLVLGFVMSMLLMIISPNMISILLGWDGLGLVSYCLVIYFQNFKSFNSGMLTILTNRIGDVAILISISWMMNFGSWNFLYYLNMNSSWFSLILFLLILAGFTKSAQIPFSSWLPAAMAAPTPVSALVHSSTLVTAGVYLLIRFNVLFMNYDCSILVFIGLMTMFMSGLGANFEFDLKKIIALSTLSQLGLMMSILFVGLPIVSFFHLLTHAFFKALLFLCAGLIIHCMSDSQDIRHMGGIIYFLPYTSACFCISNLSLCGIPFMSGFYSKDMMLELYSMSGLNLFMYLIFYISVGLTVSYTFRLIYFCISGNMNVYSCQSYSEDFLMNLSMVFLVMMSIFSGSSLSWLLFTDLDLSFMPFLMKFMTLLMILLGLFFGYELSRDYNFTYYKNYILKTFLGSMWFMPSLSTLFIYFPFLNLSYNYNKVMDMGWGEMYVSSLLTYFISFMSKITQSLYLNNLKYMMYSFLFLLIIINL